MNMNIENTKNSVIEFVVFKLGDHSFGVEISNVQEINQNVEATEVYDSPDYVSGVVNLRGQIVTVINMHKRLNIDYEETDAQMRNIVVESGGEFIGLLVDAVEDIVTTNSSELLSPPTTTDSNIGKYLFKVYKMEEDLVGILDIEKLLERTH